MASMVSALCSSVRANVGGVVSGVDAVAMVEVGASAVQAGGLCGQLFEIWPCFSQWKYFPSVWSLCMSSSVRVALALVHPISIASGSLGQLKAFCHCSLVPLKYLSLCWVLSLRNMYSQCWRWATAVHSSHVTGWWNLTTLITRGLGSPFWKTLRVASSSRVYPALIVRLGTQQNSHQGYKKIFLVLNHSSVLFETSMKDPIPPLTPCFSTDNHIRQQIPFKHL